MRSWMTAGMVLAGLAGCETAVEPKDEHHELGCIAGMMTGAVLGGLVAGPVGVGAGEEIGDGVGAAAGGVEGTPMTCDPAKEDDKVPWG